MKKTIWVVVTITSVLLLGGLITACGSASPEPELAELPTLAATLPLPLPETNVPPTLEPTNTVVPPTQKPLVPTPTLPPTETSVVNFAATDTPTPTRLPGVLPTYTPTAMAPMQIGVGFPGTIGPSEFRIHLVEGIEDQTIYAAVRVKPGVDAGLLVFEGDIAELAKDAKKSVQDLLISASAEREANFNGPGLMETMAFTPSADGPITLVVTSTADSEGLYRLYVFDKATASANVVYNQTVELAAEQTTSVAATSNGGKPVVAFMNPLDPALDSKIVLKRDNGSVITEANYVGPGLHESAFAQPLITSVYTVDLINVGSATGLFEIIVIAMQDPF